MIRNIKKEKKKLVLWICLLLTLGLGLGYAVLTEQLKMNGSVNYGSMAWDVGFTTAEDGGGTVTSYPSVSSDKKSVTVTCNVGTSTSSETCIAKAKIKNASSFAVQLESNPTITFDDTYIKSVSTVWTSNNENVVAADSIESGAEKEIQLTITTKELTSDMLPESTLSIPITITMDWVEGEAQETENITYAFKDIQTILSEQTNPSATASANPSLFPIFYNSNEAYKNTKLYSLELKVGEISSLNEDQKITLHIADKSILSSKDVSSFMNSDKFKSYEIIVSKENFSSYSNTKINDYISIDLSSYNINVGEEELIGIGSTSDTISWPLRNVKQTSSTLYPELYLSYTSSNAMTNGTGLYSLLLNFKIGQKSNSSNDNSSNEDLENSSPEYDEQYNVLKGKNLSILGDSISTYKGYSNDAVNTNSTIGSNSVYYNGNNGLTGVNDTWWMQTINTTGMNLLVNNSWSGSSTIGALNSNNAAVGIRAENLHDDTGDNAGTNPDVIVVYMGTNDLGKSVGDYSASDFYDNLYIDSDSDGEYDNPTTFDQAYAITLDKISKKYPDAKIFTFTILANNWVDPTINNERINNAIKSISNHYNAAVVDIYTETGITPSNAADYMLGNEASHIHPNESGMDKITEVFIERLLEEFSN